MTLEVGHWKTKEWELKLLRVETVSVWHLDCQPFVSTTLNCGDAVMIILRSNLIGITTGLCEF